MLSRANRFHGRASLRYVYQNGKMVRGPLLGLKYAVNERRQAFRCAIVVSKKISKSAVKRNRVRRQLYAIVGGLAPQITQPYDLVITVFSDQALSETGQRLEQQLQRQLRQAGVVAKAAPTSKRATIKTKEN